MKLFKNLNKENGKPYYQTSFYSEKDGEKLRKPLFVNFKWGYEPPDKDSYDMELKAVIDGTWYDAKLTAYKDKSGEIVGTLYLERGGHKTLENRPKNVFKRDVRDEAPFVAQSMTEYLNEDEAEPEQIKLSSDDLPFY